MVCVMWCDPEKYAHCRHVPDDNEVDEYLQQLRQATGEDWMINVTEHRHRSRWGVSPKTWKGYELWIGLGAEIQVLNLASKDQWRPPVTDTGSREHVINYMLGYLAGTQAAKYRQTRLANPTQDGREA